MTSQNIRQFLSKLMPSPATLADMFSHAYVHPCVINNQPTIVYPRGLQQSAPLLYSQLRKYFSNQGYALKEDQRSANSHAGPVQRRQWVPIILFTATLFFESSANADIEINLDKITPAEQQHITLQLISNQPLRTHIQQQIDNSILPTPNITQTENTISETIYSQLQQHYQKQPGDPAYISDDLKQMANYYSRFPEVISLLTSLQNKNWQLVFDEDNWTTVASGNMMAVDNAVIHFNTRSAAQLRLNNSCESNPVCIASPADALLHELLHTYSMLINTRQFLQQGGMSRVLYPYQHERNIIQQERTLYRQMTQHDNLLRPYRHNHAGRIIKAHCSTCIN